jgi:hypothetical protein
MSIFVSVVGYRDTELEKTVRNLYNSADDKDGLTIAVISQDIKTKHPKLSDIPAVVQKNIHYSEAKGAGYARKIAMDLYYDEDYFFQIDSHMRFCYGWDTKLKNILKKSQEKANTDKVIVSQFPAPYNLFSNGKIYYPKGDEFFWDEPSWTSVVNTWNGVWAGNRERFDVKGGPHKSHTILAGLLFAPGYITNEVPYDERISFMGEELCFAIRAYTRHWEIYAPDEMVAWHWYKRKEMPKIWKDDLQNRSWLNIEYNSQDVQRRVLTGEEKGIYGIGDYDRYVEYQKMIGIDFKNFYNHEIEEVLNLAVITKEIDFNLDSVAKTGYCNKDLHSKCDADDFCFCQCHKEKK